VGAFASAPEAEASGSAFVVAAIHQVDPLDVIGFTLLEQKSVHDCAPPLLHIPHPIRMEQLLDWDLMALPAVQLERCK
jgi:hypothetical protein